jgi:hypothetical protein
MLATQMHEPSTDCLLDGCLCPVGTHLPSAALCPNSSSRDSECTSTRHQDSQLHPAWQFHLCQHMLRVG